MLNNLNIIPSAKYIRLLLILLLLCITIFLRIYKISSIPPGLNQDESAIGYNAYSILQTGKDEWGVSYPLYFKSFGDQKLPAYIYTTALFEKIIGVNEYAVRLPSALAGIIAVFILLSLIWYLTKNFTLGYFSAFLLAITPWHIQFSRSSFEVNFALTFALVGALAFILGVDKKKIIVLLLSLVAFSVSLYSYNVTRLLSPALLVTLVIMYRGKIKQMKLSQIIFLSIFFVITLLPFIISFFSISGVLSAKSSLITSADVLAKDVEMRSYLLSLPSLYVKIFYNQYIYIVFQYIQNILLLLSGSFFFVDGSTHPHQGIGNVGVFYLFQFPLFMLGLVLYFQKKVKQLNFLFIWLLVSALTLALSKDVPHATRGYFLVIPIVIFSALGLLYFVHTVFQMKNRILKYVYIGLAGMFIFYNIQFYFASYYFRFPYVYASNWQEGDRQLSTYLAQVESKYDKIIIEDQSNFIYTSLLFYNKYPPQKFISTVKRNDKKGLLMAESWGKYEVRSIDWEKDATKPNVLLITNEQNWPKNMPILKQLFYPARQIVISVNDHISQYPKTEFAWLIVDSNMVLRERK